MLPRSFYMFSKTKYIDTQINNNISNILKLVFITFLWLKK